MWNSSQTRIVPVNISKTGQHSDRAYCRSHKPDVQQAVTLCKPLTWAYSAPFRIRAASSDWGPQVKSLYLYIATILGVPSAENDIKTVFL
jgi:hypothetical protein